VWRVLLNKVPTKDNLVHRRVGICNTLYELCNQNEKNVKHLFVGCPISKLVWDMCDRWVGICFVHHNQLRTNFQQFNLRILNEKQIKCGSYYGWQ